MRLFLAGALIAGLCIACAAGRYLAAAAFFAALAIVCFSPEREDA
jgi:hypothetical protein